MSSLPLLSLLLALPALAGLALPWLSGRWPRRLALAAALLALALALWAVARFDPLRPGFQLLEQRLWWPGIGVQYLVGVDGLSLLFLPATALLFLVVIFATPVARSGLYYSLLLWLEAATLGVFCALDGVLFFVCWELTVPPLYFLIALWGDGPSRRAVAARYFSLMLAGGVPLLFALVALATQAGGGEGFNFALPYWLQHPPGYRWQIVIFLLLIVGFGVKVPFLPFHTWLPGVALQGPPAIAALLVGLKLGVFGLLRWTFPLLPEAAKLLHWLPAGLGTLAILYGAVAAVAQSNLRSMLAYWSLSHVGLAVLALSSLNEQGVIGATWLLLNFVPTAAGLFLLLDALLLRSGSLDVSRLGGVTRTMPLLSALFLLFGLAAMGMPGTTGFPGEFAALLGAIRIHAGAAMGALFGAVVGAAAFLHPYRQAFFGPATRPAVLQAPDLNGAERLWALALALLVLGFGLFPTPLLRILQPAAAAWLRGLG
ncbi:MAG: hypothetical protein RIR00_466 [Pseudomonadota bacterium]